MTLDSLIAQLTNVRTNQTGSTPVMIRAGDHWFEITGVGSDAELESMSLNRMVKSLLESDNTLKKIEAALKG